MNDDVLRRRFIAIATDRFVADGTFHRLDGVAAEVDALKQWLCAPGLGDRAFSQRGYEALARCPSEDNIRAKLVADRFNDGDAVVLYVTGHGRADKGAHWTILERSEPSRLASTALSTVQLVRWLAEHKGLDNVLLVIDLCEAGDLEDEMPSSLRRELPDSWVALLTTPAGHEAKVGAFTNVVTEVIDNIRTGNDRDATALDRYLRSDVFIREVKRLLHDRYKQHLIVLHDPYEPSCCLPNPKYRPGGGERVATAPERRDLAVLAQDMSAHWAPRARGMADDALGAASEWLFTGREAVMQQLIDATSGAPATLVVTGRAGSGRSAVLARLVTCSDSLFRGNNAAFITGTQPVPAEGSVDVAVLATGKSPWQVASQVLTGLGGPPSSHTGELRDLLDDIDHVLEARDAPATIVLDALDEASDPSGIVQNVLRRLNPARAPRVRMIVAVRATDSEDHARAWGPLELATSTRHALRATGIAVDGDDCWRDQDLHEYVRKILTRAQASYADDPALAEQVATHIVASAQRSYLLAALVAFRLAAEPGPKVADGAEIAALFEGSVGNVLAREIDASFDEAEDRTRARVLLRATALAYGRGLPWRDLWPRVATSIAGGRQFSDADIAWLLAQRVSGYLVRDLEDGVTVYRPFHDALRASLDAAGPKRRDADRVITGVLLESFSSNDPSPPSAYARRHLVQHAAGGEGLLDESVLNPRTLPWLDVEMLSQALRLTEAEPHTALWLWLSAWRSVRQRFSFAHPERNAAALDVALCAIGSQVPARSWRRPLAWETRWVDWSFGGTVVASDTRGLRGVAFAEVAGRPVVAVAGSEQVDLWDAATGLRIGEPIDAASDIRSMAMTSTLR